MNIDTPVTIISLFLLYYFFYRIDDKGVIKVADFGLTEDIYTKNYFKQFSSSSTSYGSTLSSGGESVRLPVKWMALESLHDGIFSEKTDVVRTFNKQAQLLMYMLVVLWCAVLGGIQSWEDSISWNRTT